MTPLHYAVHYGVIENIKLLLTITWLNVNIGDNNGVTLKLIFIQFILLLIVRTQRYFGLCYLIPVSMLMSKIISVKCLLSI